MREELKGKIKKIFINELIEQAVYLLYQLFVGICFIIFISYIPIQEPIYFVG